MSKYVERVLEEVKKNHPSEPEFQQTVEEVLSSLAPVIDKHPEYEKAGLLERMVEPERIISFRVTWTVDIVSSSTAQSVPSRAACGSIPL